MPQESCRLKQVSIASHFLFVLEHSLKCVDCFLVHVPAALVVVDKSNAARILNLSSVLNAGQLPDCLRYRAFVENAERLPEDQNGVLASFELLESQQAALTVSQRLRIEHQNCSLM